MWQQRTIDPQGTWCLGFRFRTSGLPQTGASVIIAALVDTAGIQVDLRLNGDGTLSVTRNGTALTGGTSTAIVPTNTWIFLEWKTTISASITAGQCVVNLNGVQAISVAAGQSTKAQTNSTANQIRLAGDAVGQQGSGYNLDFGDLYACDGATGETGPTGDRKVVVRLPDGDVAGNPWVGVDGDSTNNYLLVGLVTSQDDTYYVQSSTTGDRDLYTLQDHGSGVANVYGVQQVFTARKNAAGARSFAAVAKNLAGTITQGSTITMGDSYAQSFQVWPTVPGSGAAWTLSEYDALQVGQILVS
jgi:hypothetical protein